MHAAEQGLSQTHQQLASNKSHKTTILTRHIHSHCPSSYPQIIVIVIAKHRIIIHVTLHAHQNAIETRTSQAPLPKLTPLYSQTNLATLYQTATRSIITYFWDTTHNIYCAFLFTLPLHASTLHFPNSRTQPQPAASPSQHHSNNHRTKTMGLVMWLFAWDRGFNDGGEGLRRWFLCVLLI